MGEVDHRFVSDTPDNLLQLMITEGASFPKASRSTFSLFRGSPYKWFSNILQGEGIVFAAILVNVVLLVASCCIFLCNIIFSIYNVVKISFMFYNQAIQVSSFHRTSVQFTLL